MHRPKGPEYSGWYRLHKAQGDSPLSPNDDDDEENLDTIRTQDSRRGISDSGTCSGEAWRDERGERTEERRERAYVRERNQGEEA